MEALEVTSKITELKEVYGDLKVLINVQGGDNSFFKEITSVDIQEGLRDEDGSFIDERVILITCE